MKTTLFFAAVSPLLLLFSCTPLPSTAPEEPTLAEAEAAWQEVLEQYNAGFASYGEVQNAQREVLLLRLQAGEKTEVKKPRKHASGQ